MNQFNSTESCQICSVSFRNMDATGRQAHYDEHFADEDQVASGSISCIPKKSFKARMPALSLKYNAFVDKMKITNSNMPPSSENVFWHRSMSTLPPFNYTPGSFEHVVLDVTNFTTMKGLLSVLKHALLRTHSSGYTQRAILCYEGMVHVATESWDMGWGCGYRNFLMSCTALIDQQLQPLYFPLLDEPIPPGVRNLQYWVENAWDLGYDMEGAEQLNHKLINTKKWIGTAELYVAFISRGIPVRLVDFPKSKRGPKALVEWVIKYFSPPTIRTHINVNDVLRGASPVVCTEKMPLVLQHQGHSRTIIGYEITRSGDTNLLIFDPSKKPSSEIREVALRASMLDGPNSPSNSVSLSPSKIMRRMLQSSGMKRKRDTGSDPPEDQGHSNYVKRVRGGLVNQEGREMTDANTEHRVSVSSDIGPTLDPLKTVRLFSLSLSKLGRNDQYQILWFPLEDPLEEPERLARRVVTSERVI